MTGEEAGRRNPKNLSKTESEIATVPALRSKANYGYSTNKRSAVSLLSLSTTLSAKYIISNFDYSVRCMEKCFCRVRCVNLVACCTMVWYVRVKLKHFWHVFFRVSYFGFLPRRASSSDANSVSRFASFSSICHKPPWRNGRTSFERNRVL